MPTKGNINCPCSSLTENLRFYFWGNNKIEMILWNFVNFSKDFFGDKVSSTHSKLIVVDMHILFCKAFFLQRATFGLKLVLKEFSYCIANLKSLYPSANISTKNSTAWQYWLVRCIVIGWFVQKINKTKKVTVHCSDWPAIKL